MWFVVSHALSKFINDRSDWLSAEVVATAGVTDNTRSLLESEEKMASTVNVTMLPGADIWGAEHDYYPKMIASLTMLSEVWVTLDPSIKTMEDFSGKTVVIPRDVPFGYKFIYQNWVNQYAEDVKFMHGGINSRLTALRDGAADVGTLPIDYYYPDTYAKSSGLIELSARGDLYFPNQGKVEENLHAVAQACVTDPFVGEYKLPPLGMVMPPEVLDGQPEKNLVFVSCPIYWSAGEQMPDDVVCEITKVIYEAAQDKDFAPYHAIGKGITADFVVTSFWKTDEEREENYHPGALKYYRDNNIQLKFFGEWEQ
ncbi:hypothetical protein [Desulfovermiculus halophilus]|uniref:hypothetical protein n=1 Tax=Desulfovermiculus halophilus TaxID=339722 RepID=UPI0012946D51|nr:hypothetical protein [Desulfovermiculus halophilus]